MTERGALALLRFSLDLELFNHQMALNPTASKSICSGSVSGGINDNKRELLPPNPFVRRLSGEAVMCGWLAWENYLIELLDCNCRPLSTVQCPNGAPTNRR